jgi:hypothetical protein
MRAPLEAALSKWSFGSNGFSVETRSSTFRVALPVVAAAGLDGNPTLEPVAAMSPRGSGERLGEAVGAAPLRPCALRLR